MDIIFKNSWQIGNLIYGIYKNNIFILLKMLIVYFQNQSMGKDNFQWNYS